MKYSDRNYVPLYGKLSKSGFRFHGAKLDRMYRILLDRPPRDLSWYRIAKQAEVAYGWAHSKLRDLQQMKLIQGSRVLDASGLFRLWASHKVPIYVREYHVKEAGELIQKAGMDYALTKYHGENLLNNYLFPKLFDLYVHSPDLPRWHALLSQAGYVGHGNVRLLVGDSHVFYGQLKVKGWPLVSVQQLMVDLIREGAECIEAVEQLLKRFYNDRGTL